MKRGSGGKEIPVVDLFAGPGGLGEGFATGRNGKSPGFRLALSIEKDPVAHRTLRLRAFRRQFEGLPPKTYLDALSRGAEWEALRSEHRREAVEAEREARCLELGPESVDTVRSLISEAVPRAEPWVLIGGPPCQAYSLVGRARNRGVRGYRPEADKRQTLYIEYLQILADHAPAVFVMENVKGLLSAQLKSVQLFDRIREDLSDPAAALAREGRGRAKRRPRYEVRSLVAPSGDGGDLPGSYVVRAERYGIPQRRHRVILVGVRSDLDSRSMGCLRESKTVATVEMAIGALPDLRSGVTGGVDSDQVWLETVKAILGRSWLLKTEPPVSRRLRHTLRDLRLPSNSRGADVIRQDRGRLLLNHSSRGHMASDLERYVFASCFAAELGRSPRLDEFPRELLPEHSNVSVGVAEGLFADRFRVQLGGAPSTTVTSHISKDGHYYIHPDPSQCRSLTVREAARLQTFPDDYFFCGPRTAQYHQVGNAVPPALASKIAAVIAEFLG